MKKNVLLIYFLAISMFASAQTFVSNNMSKYSTQFERIDFYDDDQNSVVSLAPKFYRLSKQKKRIKPIKVDGQSYFIRLGRNGIQSVYDDSGEHIAIMERDGETMQLIQNNSTSTYKLDPVLRLTNPNVLKCFNSEDELVSEISLNFKSKRLEYNDYVEGDTNLLLMSLCIHKYQELLLRSRGRLVAAY